MKKLMIHFVDTSETLLLDENTSIFAWANNKEPGISTDVILEFDEHLPDNLRKRPLMFYVYEDISILKLYRSVYIDFMEWVD